MSNFDQLLHIYDYVRPILDVLILTFILYKGYEIIVKTQGLQIFRTLIVLALAYVFAMVFKLSTLRWLLNLFTPSLFICFAIVFQPELRKIFLKIGQSGWRRTSKSAEHGVIDAVLTAADLLSSQKRGALVCFLRQAGVNDVLENGNGTLVNAEVSSALIVSIFGYDTPLHDGAVVIQGSKIHSAGCFLPLSDQFDIKKTFGTRHRAALGMSENSDAVVLVVSEETGAISLAYDASLHYDLSIEQAEKMLEDLLGISKEDSVMELENEK